MDGGGAGAGAGASGGGKEASCDWRTREDWVTLRRVATRPRPPYLPANWRVSASGPPARRDHALCSVDCDPPRHQKSTASRFIGPSASGSSMDKYGYSPTFPPRDRPRQVEFEGERRTRLSSARDKEFRPQPRTTRRRG